tara:strand:- start:1168 stop:1878 length:711 start_codon:yes stop_codon:yes gene_type:complete
MNKKAIPIIDFDLSRMKESPSVITVGISKLFVYLIHESNLEEAQKKTFLKIIQEKNLPMVEMAKQFAFHLTHNFSDEVGQELSAIQNKEIGFENMLDNEELVDFVEMELVDPTTTYRKWEFGKFAVQYFINKINSVEFENIEGNNDIATKEFIESFASNLDTKAIKLDDHEKLFLIVAIRNKLSENNLNIATYDLMGSFVHRNLLGMSLRMDILKNSFQESLSLTIKNQNHKGPKR